MSDWKRLDINTELEILKSIHGEGSIADHALTAIEQLEAEVTRIRSTWTPPEDDEPPEDK